MLLRYLLILAAWAAGITLLQTLPVLPAHGWLAAFFLPAFLALFFVRTRPMAAILFAVALGFTYASLRAESRLAGQLPAALEGQTVTIRGHIADLPQAARYGQRFILATDPATLAGIPARIQVNWYGKPPPLAAGQRWQLQLRLKRPHGTQNPGAFDAESWLLQQDIGATASVRTAEALPADGLDAWLARLRNQIRQYMQNKLGDAPYAGVIIALAIGDQGGIPAQQWQRFANTGVTHLVSISGLHITLLAALAALTVRFFWRRSAWLCARFSAPRAALAAGVCMAIAYSLMAGMTIPTQRTLLMLLVATWGLWRTRVIPASAIWLTALALVLLFDPFATLSPGFWLSFLTVGALLWAGQRTLGTAPRWQGWLTTQWAATLATTPVLLLWFGQLPLYSPLANGFAIPAVSLLVTPLALAGLLDPSGMLLHAAERVFAMTDWLLMHIETWPWANSSLHMPPAWTMLPAATGIAILLAPRGLPGRWLGCCGLIPLFLPAGNPLPAGEFEIRILDVGQGQAVLVRTQQHQLLFDTGPPGSERSILPVLRQNGQTTVDVLVLSHNDKDHTGAAEALLPQFPKARLMHGIPGQHSLLAGRTASRCVAGEHWQWDGVTFRWLWPPADFSKSSDNAGSCVLLVDNGRQRVLIPADIGQTEESALLAQPLPRVDVLLAAHHGSKSSSGADWIAALAPRHVVFSVGYLNRFRHPHPDTQARFAEAGSRAWLTARDGAILIRSGAELDIRGWREQRPRYWYTAISSAPLHDTAP
ncbi:DNA internalization-related competence protein ComEC/Rec2 [Chitinilyticum aquatile]|uniref:DNA internalization-related competence protein ComEC/Rec2 n=1 Tax=Chitinilyticum aquatile TaxID=362520 RepID=UPI000416AC69|nr:DNA internalization-related competence protein ComEC/Rec2 [Chitinilyticum aquatile]